MSNLRVTTLTDTAEIDEAIEKYLNFQMKGKELRRILKNFRGEAYSKQRFREVKEARRNLFKRPPTNQPKTVDQLKREREEKLRKEREKVETKKAINEYLNRKMGDEEFRRIFIKAYGEKKAFEQLPYYFDAKYPGDNPKRLHPTLGKTYEELFREYGKKLSDAYYSPDNDTPNFAEFEKKYKEENIEEFKNYKIQETRDYYTKGKGKTTIEDQPKQGIEVTTEGGSVVMPRTTVDTTQPSGAGEGVGEGTGEETGEGAGEETGEETGEGATQNQDPSKKQAEEIKEELKRGDIDTDFHDEYPNNSRNTINYENLSDLFIKTIRLSDGVYSPQAREMFQPEGESYYFSEYDTPFLIHKQGSTLYLAFRGTDFIDAKDGSGLFQGDIYYTFSNLMTDANVAGRIKGSTSKRGEIVSGQDPLSNPILSQFLPQSLAEIKFHSGILQAVADIYPECRRNLDKFKGLVNDLVITGHSLGGGMSAIFYYIYRNDVTAPEKKIKVSRVITYGSPRVLVNKQQYIDNYNGRCGRQLIRVWNKFDLITYIPFNNVSSQLLANIAKYLSGGLLVASQFTHIGKSFCLNGDYQNQNVNLLIQETIRRGGDILKVLLSNKENLETSRLIKFMLSEKYEKLLLTGLCVAGEKIRFKNDINKTTLKVLALKLQEESEKIFNYADKCKLLERFNLEQVLLDNPIGEDQEQENFTIATIAPLIYRTYTSSGYGGLFPNYTAHSTDMYRRLLDKLIDRERLENIAINYPITDSDDEDQEETEDNAILATEKGNLSINLDRPKIVGIIENNVLPKGTFISIKK